MTRVEKGIHEIEQKRLSMERMEIAMLEQKRLSMERVEQALLEYGLFINKDEFGAIIRALKATMKKPEARPRDRTRPAIVPIIAAKFNVNGSLWTGRGRAPLTFQEWDRSKEGLAWHKKNPMQQYPFAEGYEPTDEDLNWTSLTERRDERRRMRAEAKLTDK